MTEVPTVEVDGTRLAYREWGDPDAPCVLLLHSLAETSGTWRTVGAALADEHRVLAPDLRGHGRSAHAADYSIERMAADVVGLLDALGIDRAAVVAHSLGAMVTYVLAPDHPDRLGPLVLEEPPPPVAPAVPRPLPDREQVTRCDWAAVEAIYHQRNHPDPAWWDGIARIEAPTLVVAGGGSSHLDQAEVAALAARLPHGELVTVPVGHHIHHQRPDEMIALVRGALSERSWREGPDVR